MKATTAALACAALALALTPAADIAFGALSSTAFAKNDNGGGGGNGGGNGGGSADRGNGGGNAGKSDRSAGRSANSGAPKKRASGGGETVVVAKSNAKAANSLKGLNAAHASLVAMANASPNSRVGRIAAYREAYLEHQAALDDPARLAQRQAYLDALAALDADATPEEIEAALAAIEALDDDGDFTEEDVRAALAELNPEATDEEIDAAVEALAGAVEADNELDADAGELADLLAAAAAPHDTLEEGTDAWDRFHELLRLDDPLPAAGDEPDADAEEALLQTVDNATAD